MADALFEPEVSRSLVVLHNLHADAVPPIAIECKRTMEARLSFDRVKEEQVQSLLDFESKGLVRKLVVSQGFGKARRFTGDTPFDFIMNGPGISYVLVNFRFTKKSPRKDIPKGTNRCFAVRIRDYVDAVEQEGSKGRASLNYDWFVENAIECTRIRIGTKNGNTTGGWDLLPLLTHKNGDEKHGRK